MFFGAYWPMYMPMLQISSQMMQKKHNVELNNPFACYCCLTIPFYEHTGPILGLKKQRAYSGSKRFDNLMVFFIGLLWNNMSRDM